MKLNMYLRITRLVLAASLLSACGNGTDTDSESAAQQSTQENAAADPPAGAGSAPPAAAVAYDCPDNEPSLVDFCLGMTPDQVIAALQARYPDAGIQQRQMTFDYSDGASTLRTEPFTSVLRLETEDDEYFEFVFTAPPGDGRLVWMQRMLGSDSNLPDLETFTAALVDRYGEPAFSHRGTSGTILNATLRWDFPADRILCSDPPQKDSGLLTTATSVRPGTDVETMVAKLNARGIDNPAKCAKWLQAHIQTFSENEPVRSVDMKLSDFAGGVAGARATYAWLEETEAAARAERLKNAQVPEL